MRKRIRSILAVPALIVLAIGVYYIPPVHDRLSWRLDDLRTLVIYFFKPPDQAVFRPGQSQQAAIEAIVSATMQAHAAAQIPLNTPDPIAGPTTTPTLTPQPLPVSVSLPGVKYENQFNRWNYCGPANFSMALTFWGWKGNRDDIGRAVKPSEKDKNVMPYEFQDFIAGNVSGITSVLRYGGNIEVIQRLVAGGFPVIAEKGEYQYDTTGKISWMGHYQFITGYDNASQTLLIQDTYLDGPNLHMPFNKFMEGWRSFNYVFVVVYPVDRESDVMSLLGQYADSQWATQHALDISKSESASLGDSTQQFFAWFNSGTSHVERLEYVDAASAYDKAFQIYATLDPGYSTRPFRMLWYQTGPYKAYFYSQRYQDVFNLADTTLNTVSEPVLEESLYWRGRAEAAMGPIQSAIDDYHAALKVHPKYPPAILGLQDLGVAP
jgi:Peptidase_C39 like family